MKADELSNLRLRALCDSVPDCSSCPACVTTYKDRIRYRDCRLGYPWAPPETRKKPDRTFTLPERWEKIAASIRVGRPEL